MQGGRLGFQVDLARAPSEVPDATREKLSSPYFADLKIGGVRTKLFIPTNEIVREADGRREPMFAPPLREEAKPQKPGSEKRKAPRA
jgi:hypothetical protein